MSGPGAIELEGTWFNIPAAGRVGVARDQRLAVAFFSGAPVARRNEIYHYSLEPGAVDLSFVRTGRAPLLMEHCRNLESLIGSIATAKHEDGVISAIVRFARTPEADRLWTMLDDDFPLSLSLGAVIRHAIRLEDTRDGIPVYRVTSWAMEELSVVTYGAERGAYIRKLHRDETCEELTTRLNPEPEAQALALTRSTLKLDRWKAWAGGHAPARLVNEFGLDPVPFFDALGREVADHCAELERDFAL